MSINLENKQEFAKKFGKNEKDTGSSAVQIAMMTTKIAQLTEHLKSNKKDSRCFIASILSLVLPAKTNASDTKKDVNNPDPILKLTSLLNPSYFCASPIKTTATKAKAAKI